ncbi:MAG: zinc-dependent metalloprotease [Planctomyces sp.]|nr:zinc-dependent metalloprotease [Planctomyces sp.]
MVQSRSFLAALAALAILSAGRPAPAQEQPAKSKYDQLIEGKTKIEGLWTLFHKEQQLLVDFKQSDLNKEYIVLPSIARGVSSGSVIGGMSWQEDDDIIWTFKKVDEKLFVIRRNVRYRAAPNSPEAKAVELAYSDSVLYALPILATSPRQTLLVDVTPIFMNDDLNIGRALGAFRLAMDRTTWGKLKAFPNNLELQVNAVYSGTGVSTVPDSRGVQVGVHYSISPLPAVGSNGYKPRVADDRVGYFLTAVKDYSNRDDDDHFVRYITRWDLRKRDASLEVSPPEKPIEFYIEKTCPVFLRPTVEAGILEWNKAFAKIGFANAIRVQHEEDLEAQIGIDIDPEDVRYNFFRWITADAGFAMGPSRVDPRTGQILDADIIFDAGFLDSWKSQYETFTPQTAESLIPNWLGQEATVPHGLHSHHSGCSYCRDMQHQMGFAAAVMLGRGATPDGKLPEQLVHQGLKEVVMHEVGHTLGLRHNFRASAWKTLEEINHPEKSLVEPTVASVMDYTPANIATKGAPQGAYYTTTLGPYDDWAIAYGYSVLKGDEKAELAKIAARSGEAGLEYLTDEDTRGLVDSDPLSNRFDLGKDSLAYVRRQLQNSTELMPEIIEKGVKDGEGYQRATQMFGLLFREYWRAAGFAARFPGGVYVSRDHKGDAGQRPPFQPVSPAEQREAMQLLTEFVFAPPKIEGSQLNYLAVSRWRHWGTPNVFRLDMPIHEQVLDAQSMVLRQLMNSTTLRRILDNEFKTPADQEAYTLAEHLQSIVDGIFGEWKPADQKGEYTVRAPMISGFRRNLQRETIRQFAALTTQSTGPEDARTLARMHLQSLQAKIGAMLQNGELKLDDYTRAHLQDCQSRIAQALEAKVSLPSVN